MSASVLEAQDAERRAMEGEKGARKALEAAEINKEAAEKKAASAAEEAEELRRQVKAQVRLIQGFRQSEASLSNTFREFGPW